MTKCINARCETECFDTFCDDRCEAGFLRDANKELKSELEALRACTSQEIEIKALVLIGEIGAAVGNVYDTALHLTIGGMINQFNEEAVASPRD